MADVPQQKPGGPSSSRHSERAPWFGLNMVGLVASSLVLPALAGAALGIWLDELNPGVHSWTLTLLIGGLAAGGLNAWNLVAREQRRRRAAQEMEETATRERAERELARREMPERKSADAKEEGRERGRNAGTGERRR